MRRGYLTPPVVIALALFTLFVAAILYVNSLQVKTEKNEPRPTPETAPTSNQALASPSRTGILKNIKLAVILVKFQDTNDEPYSKSEIESIIFKDDNSVKNFFEKGSYNKWSFSWDTFRSYTIPYTVGNLCNQENTDVAQIIQDKVTNEWSKSAENLVGKDGIDLVKYSNILFIFPKDQLGCSFGGWHIFGGNRSFVIVPSIDTIVHELGHAFNLAHANTLSCARKTIDKYENCVEHEYGDPGDIMGGYELSNNATPQFNSPHKIALGWIPESDIVTAKGSGIYTIYPFEQVSSKPKVIKIAKPETEGRKNEYYYLEYRQPIDIFDAALPEELTQGVSIRIWNGASTDPTKLLDTTPQSCIADPTQPNNCPGNHGDFSDAALSDGRSFYDDIAGVTITQINHDKDSATVSIRFIK